MSTQSTTPDSEDPVQGSNGESRSTIPLGTTHYKSTEEYTAPVIRENAFQKQFNEIDFWTLQQAASRVLESQNPQSQGPEIIRIVLSARNALETLAVWSDGTFTVHAPVTGKTRPRKKIAKIKWMHTDDISRPLTIGDARQAVRFEDKMEIWPKVGWSASNPTEEDSGEVEPDEGNGRENRVGLASGSSPKSESDSDVKG